MKMSNSDSLGFDKYECPCCASTDWKVDAHLPAFIFSEEVEIIACRICGCGATWPPPRLNANYYQNNQGYSDLFTQNENLYKDFAKSLLHSLVGIVDLEGKTLLDVGCGGGFLVQVATESKMIAEGLEANESMVAWAKQKGLNVSDDSIEQMISIGKRYDVIVLSAILEHLERPQELLRLCQDILVDGGVVLITQASFDGLLPRIFPWGWYGWQPQEHYWHFTPSSFARIAESADYKTVKSERGSLYHQWFTSGGIKVVMGRNIATLIARLGNVLHSGDSFNTVLKRM